MCLSSLFSPAPSTLTDSLSVMVATIVRPEAINLKVDFQKNSPNVDDKWKQFPADMLGRKLCL